MRQRSRLSHLRVFFSLFFLIFSVGSALPLRAAVDPEANFFADIVQIATKREQSLEQAPSIVSVFTAEDIERYGARELTDVLRLVPGFEFGIDVQALVGLGSRGIWVHEGKVLMMINGVMVNDLGFGNFNFIGAIPAEMIQRVEIIRGPGSALYGGFAEVATINVITRKGADLRGARLSAAGSGLGSGEYGGSAVAAVGDARDGLDFSWEMGATAHPFSRRAYSDIAGGQLQLGRENFGREWRHIVTQAKVKDLTVAYNRNTLDFLATDGFVTIYPRINGVNQDKLENRTETWHADYKIGLGEGASLQPLVEYTRGTTVANGLFGAGTASTLYQGPGLTLYRLRSELSASYAVPSAGDVTVGGGYIRDSVEDLGVDGQPGLFNSADPMDFAKSKATQSRFGLAQYVLQGPNAGLTLGGRYESTTFGSAFAPRAGVTYVRDAFNAKLLYGRAFRIPLPWQTYGRILTFRGTDLDPETADNVEVEAGYKVSRHISAKANAFFIDIRKPIVYIGSNNSYQNFGRNQSYGAEGEIQVKYVNAGGFFNASWARPTAKSDRGFTTDSKDQFLALPPVKLNLGTYVQFGGWHFSPTATFLSPRAGQTVASGQSNGTPGEFKESLSYPALTLVNLQVFGKDIVQNIDVHLTVSNIFKAGYVLIQPYYGAHAPLPVGDRQVSVGVTWKI